MLGECEIQGFFSCKISLKKENQVWFCTSKLWVGGATPLAPAVTQTLAAHHVAHGVMTLVPLIPQAVHDIIYCADFLMSWRTQESAVRLVLCLFSYSTKYYISNWKSVGLWV